MNLNHRSVWSALDNLAHFNRISVSRLAILAKIDSTTFNKSKRTDNYGRPRWPSTETLSKVFNSMHINWSEFENFFPENYDKYRAQAIRNKPVNKE